jgi:integral membrane sensor domain MASE1
MDESELRQLATSYLQWRTHGLTALIYFRHSAHRVWPGMLFYLALAALFHWAGYDVVVVGILSFCVGMAIRDVQWAQTFVRSWPKVTQVIDWAKVERLAGEGTKLADFLHHT